LSGYARISRNSTRSAQILLHKDITFESDAAAERWLVGRAAGDVFAVERLHLQRLSSPVIARVIAEVPGLKTLYLEGITELSATSFEHENLRGKSSR